MSKTKNKQQLIKQGSEFQFKNETKIFHFEFTPYCNQNCPYCIEGNFDLSLPKPPFSKSDDVLGALDKIFAAYDESITLGFIIVGGEPTLQPSFLDFVKKIKTRRNTQMILTTNFTQSVDYYKKLDIPLIPSVHLEYHNPKDWLEKTIELKDLIVSTRIMAHPKKMDKVREVISLFEENCIEHNLTYEVAGIMSVNTTRDGKELNYECSYNDIDNEYLSNLKPHQGKYSVKLTNQASLFIEIFSPPTWVYITDGNLEQKTQEYSQGEFKGWFCEHSLITIDCNGNIKYGWGCYRYSKVNLFSSSVFPKHEVKAIICKEKICGMSYAHVLPKYRKIHNRPQFRNIGELMILKAKKLFGH